MYFSSNHNIDLLLSIVTIQKQVLFPSNNFFSQKFPFLIHYLSICSGLRFQASLDTFVVHIPTAHFLHFFSLYQHTVILYCSENKELIYSSFCLSSSRPRPTVQPGAGGCCRCSSWTHPTKPLSCPSRRSKTAWGTSASSSSTSLRAKPTARWYCGHNLLRIQRCCTRTYKQREPVDWTLIIKEVGLWTLNYGGINLKNQNPGATIIWKKRF